MGKRGPRPTPIKILAVRGSWRAKGNDREPVVDPAKTPAAPDYLTTDAQALWGELVPELDRMGVLGSIDRQALIRYAQAWSHWRRADRFVAENGLVYSIKDDDGNVKCLVQFPQVAIANKLSLQLLRLEQEFGLTPSARSRVQTNASKRVESSPTPAADRPRMRIAE